MGGLPDPDTFAEREIEDIFSVHGEAALRLCTRSQGPDNPQANGSCCGARIEHGVARGAHRDLDPGVFGVSGRIKDVWVAKKPSGFGFVTYEDERDAVRPR